LSLHEAYQKTVKYAWALVVDLFLMILAVEIIHRWFKPFEGFFRIQSLDKVRVIFYAVGLAQIFMIKWAANLPLKKDETGNFETAFSQLKMSSFIIYGLCEVTALLGLALFLMDGFRLHFYVFLTFSLFYFVLYFPRFREWEEWVEK